MAFQIISLPLSSFYLTVMPNTGRSSWLLAIDVKLLMKMYYEIINDTTCVSHLLLDIFIQHPQRIVALFQTMPLI